MRHTTQKRNKMKKLSFFVILITFLVSCNDTLTVDNTPIEKFDINRYLGKWYEIARFDHRYERGVELPRTTYTLLEDGTISVINVGIKDGKLKEAKGIAELTDTPALLRVTFFRPFYDDYRILLLDKDYEYALVGSSSDNYLWVLSRTPKISEDTKGIILKEAQRRGYDTSKLIWVKQIH